MKQIAPDSYMKFLATNVGRALADFAYANGKDHRYLMDKYVECRFNDTEHRVEGRTCSQVGRTFTPNIWTGVKVAPEFVVDPKWFSVVDDGFPNLIPLTYDFALWATDAMHKKKLHPNK